MGVECFFDFWVVYCSKEFWCWLVGVVGDVEVVELDVFGIVDYGWWLVV